MEPFLPIIVIEKVEESDLIPAGFMSGWIGPPESIPEGWKLADPELFITRIKNKDPNV